MLNVNMTFSLYRKIFFSFIMIILLIVTVFSMVVNIRIYMKQVDEVISTINSMCEKIHKVNLNLTKLTSLGENAILWKESNYYQYLEKATRL